MQKYIAYYRVSTKKQGASGLGLDAQKETVRQFTRDGRIIAEYTEVETGKKHTNRPQLAEALARAKLAKATLIVAKLDRLSRNVAFTSALMDSGVDFVCCDNPYATRLTIHILAAVAENEAIVTSQRTKDSLAAVKAKGVKLGSARPGHWEGRENRRGWKTAATNSAIARSKRARESYSFLIPTLLELEAKYAAEADGPVYERIAQWLNDQGHCTTTGRPFAQATVWRILHRAKTEEPAKV